MNTLTKEPDVYLVASKVRLTTDFTQSAFNRFVVKDVKRFKQFLDRCRLEKQCNVSTYPLVLSDIKQSFAIKAYELKVNSEERHELDTHLKSALIQQGFDFEETGTTLNILIKYKKIFSKKLDTNMFVAELRAQSINNGQKKSVLKMRFSNLYDENRIQFYLESMLESATKKLMSKAENGELSY